MSKSILNLNNSLSYDNNISFYDLPIVEHKKELFDEKGYTIIKNFISKDDAIDLKNKLVENSNCFKKVTQEGNNRLFYYPQSPYKVPSYITTLYQRISLLKNIIYNGHPFYIDYSRQIKSNPKDVKEVLKNQNKHTWSCFYWYKNGESHFKHIDQYGELASFLILTKINIDYNEGGLVFWKDGEEIFLDEKLEYGDLVFFDQASYYHEVKKVRVTNKQIGRLQFYIPTIPYGYMKNCYRFEDFPFSFYFTNKDNYLKKLISISKTIFEKDIHYSRLNYFKGFK